MPRSGQGWERVTLAWLAAGLVAGQFLLGVAVDMCWLSVRDPEFTILRDDLARCRAEAPDRPLVLALGSSRTQGGLRPEMLNPSADRHAPLVFNFGIPGSGPMMHQVVFRRLLAQGVRPNLVFIEVIPSGLSNHRGNSPLEERMIDSARLDTAEVAHLTPYYYRRRRLYGPWLAARLLPAYRHQAELREALRLDAGAETQEQPPIGGYGWRGRAPDTREKFDDAIRIAQGQTRFVKGLEMAQRPLHALRDLLALCRQEEIEKAIVYTPEAAAFRTLYDTPGLAVVNEEVHRLGREFNAQVYDARTWVPDEGFNDCYHLDATGAEVYTKRFAAEVLAPELQRLALRRLAAR